MSTVTLTNDDERRNYAADVLGWETGNDAQDYFTVANMQVMFGEDAITDQDVLDAIRKAVEVGQ